jgi:hypothetical protein
MEMNTNINTNKNIAVIVGVLFIIGTVAGISSVIFTGPVLGSPDYLNLIAANPNPLVNGALMVLVMGLVLAMVPGVIYPVLKKQNKILALGYVVFRGALEPITYIIGILSWLLLVPLSREYLAAGPAAASNFLALGNLALEAAKIGSALCSIVFPLGAVMLYIVLFQGKLIPRWLSVWGMIGVILLLLSAGVAELYTLNGSIATVQDILAIPIFLQEMVMAVWLIVKGFNPSAIAALSAKNESNNA